MAGTLRVILGDQLSDRLSSLADVVPQEDTLLMAEVMSEASYVAHHKQKLVMVFTAMRRFAKDIAQRGIRVRYVELDQPGNSQTIDGEIRRALAETGCDRVIITEPGEWRLIHLLQGLAGQLRADHAVELELRPDDRFICSRADFDHWARGRRELRLEFFYRMMRQRTGLLMEGDQPAGRRWNYDRDNRKRLPPDLSAPRRLMIVPAEDVHETAALVMRHFADNFGSLEDFGWATSPTEAEALRDHFIDDILPQFGDWQDAMRQGAPFLWHARLSAALNIGLLDPLDLCRRVDGAWRSGDVPLNAAEGFIRQILGWREFTRGIYFLKGATYLDSNYLAADRRLPDFYWTGRTDMACMSDVIAMTRRYAYAHHIQRLMIAGNLALLLGVRPQEVNEWFMIVYADAFEWVEAPNTHGMALYADGGIVGSKPYAASGAYINRMSNYCSSCRYDVGQKRGHDACPFNRLYWGFLVRNRAALASNPRMGLAYQALSKMKDQEVELVAEADLVRSSLGAIS